MLQNKQDTVQEHANKTTHLTGALNCTTLWDRTRGCNSWFCQKKNLKRVTENGNVNRGHTVAKHTGMRKLAQYINEYGAVGHAACDRRGQDVTVRSSPAPHSCGQTGTLHIANSVPPAGTHRDLCWNTRASYQQHFSRRLGPRWREPEESQRKGSQLSSVCSQLVYSVYRRQRMRAEITAIFK